MTSDPDPATAVKSRLLPPPPWKARVERLLEQLPRRTFVPRCVPLQQVTEVAGGERWLSMGDDPAFLLEFPGGVVPKGWVYLEAALHRSMGNRVAMLYIDRGHGFELDHGEFIPSNLRGSVRELVHIPHDAVALRWDPCEARGYFSQSPLLFHEVGPLERVVRMADRVGTQRGLLGQRSNGHAAGRWQGLTHAYLALRQVRRSHAAETYQAFLRSEAVADGAAGGVAKQSPVPSVHFVLHTGFEPGAERPALPMPAGPGAASGPRWSVVDWREPGAASQAAAAVSAGAWHIRLRQGDRLANDALPRLARFIEAHPAALVVYSDHDFLGPDGRRHSPSFKPDWNPELYFTHDYLASVCAVSSRIPGAADALVRAPDAAAFCRLVLAASGSRQAQPIAHLPLVLCHRLPGAPDADPYGGEPSQPQVLAAHAPLAAARIEPGLRPHTSRVVWPIPEPAPLVSVIIPTRDRIDLLRPCIDSLLQLTAYADFEVLVVDNDSASVEAARYFEELSARPRCRLLRHPGAFNFSLINNQAAAAARGSLLLFLNNDIEVIGRQWMHDMVRQAVRPEVGAVGAKLLYPDGTVQHAGVVMGIGGIAGHVHRFLPGTEPGVGGRAELSHAFTAVTGACLMLRRQVFEAVGGFNPALAVAFNDVDLCLRLHRRGLRNIFEARAVLRHHESMSRGQDDTDEKRATHRRERDYMLQHWQREIAADPAYNLNLSREHEDFSVRVAALPGHPHPRRA